MSLIKVQVYKKSWSCFSGDNKGNQRQQSSEYQSLYHYFYAFFTVVENQYTKISFFNISSEATIILSFFIWNCFDFISARFFERTLFRVHTFQRARFTRVKLKNETFLPDFYTLCFLPDLLLCALGRKSHTFRDETKPRTLTFKPYLIRFVSWLMSTIIKGWADEEPSWSLSKSKADWWGEDVKAAQLSNLILLKKSLNISLWWGQPSELFSKLAIHGFRDFT